MTARYLRGLGDTSILVLLERLATDRLPAELLTSTISLAELSAGIHATEDAPERSRRDPAPAASRSHLYPVAIRRRGRAAVRGLNPS